MYRTKIVAFLVLTMLSFLSYASTLSVDNSFEQLEFELIDSHSTEPAIAVSTDSDLETFDADNNTYIYAISYEVTQDAVGVNFVSLSYNSETNASDRSSGGKYEPGWRM